MFGKILFDHDFPKQLNLLLCSITRSFTLDHFIDYPEKSCLVFTLILTEIPKTKPKRKLWSKIKIL
ncbi:hypothetical protein B1J94_02380 [Leptospira kirschneri serovar Grippotyphosa]|nr:hypothetical protein B1J94_02380 [Leptospira kirschneri serovar Grippotyphosa]